jgi:segregation and condensation protein A
MRLRSKKSKAKPKLIAPVVNAVLSLEPETDLQFIARFPLADGVFEGTLLELAASLRTGKLKPIQVPLLKLTRDVLERFHALRGELELSQGDLDATFRTSSLDLASEALPHLAGVIELKARLLLPRQPNMLEEGEANIDAELEDVLEGVEALAKLEGAIQFLRDRRRERSLLLVAQVPPIKLPRKFKPLSRSLGDLVKAAQRHVRDVNIFDLSLDRITMPMAMERLRDFGRRLKKYFFHDVPTSGWGERTVVFGAMLEAMRAGELEASQPEQYGAIEIRNLDT